MCEAEKSDFHRKESGEDERRALDDLFSLVYEELRYVASMVRRNEPNVTINTTALVHEAWMKLHDSPPVAPQSRAHFKAIAARAMRQVLVDEARRRLAQKRGSGEVAFVSFEEAREEAAVQAVGSTDEMLALDDSIRELESRSPRQAKIFECRFFGGLNVAEIAALLGISESAVERDWRGAKAWIGSRIRPAKS
jgi:RNA polymerase sigma factor (TIGR02999 family)